MSGVHLAMLALSFLGFVALAVGTERHAKYLLHTVPAAQWRLAARIGGWALLAGALALGITGLATAGVGIAIWTGWICLAAVALVFALPKWPWQPPVKSSAERSPRKKTALVDEAPTRQSRRWIGWLLLASTAGAFTVAFAQVETKPLQREDAIHDQVGPWAFTFAETDRDGPELVDMDVPMKAYRLRFCESCDNQILRVTLKVNRPRAMRASGIAFEGARWERSAQIQLPSNLTGKSELWMTVVGKDGTVHQASWPMAAVSPATVAWFARQEHTK
ncbi:DUF3325 domain-containing protein [Novosphingobium guangzhouense]|uniref:DUF3325 domain-containing protein n=1 Tax=Novosphingobium guangzhouense TaxID=1850347 RepID=A0A2K2FTM1_9SPHN|nr:DUF3325 domain-containing protein [Novosphingobium guangzhouense]PNU02133.1 hypothetical protein A8V01_09640 [Novosphingobium guangzhouense]